MADLLEHAAKSLLAEAGIPVPLAQLANSPDAAARAATRIGTCVIKAQVPIGKRGKAGGIKAATTADEARRAAHDILGMEIAGHPCREVLVEQSMQPVIECYVAAMNDATGRAPMLLVSTLGGMDVEEAMAQDPQAVRRIHVDPSAGLSAEHVRQSLSGLDLAAADDAMTTVLLDLYTLFRRCDATLIEINPLAILDYRTVCALDCKFSLDDAATSRQERIASLAVPERHTDLERRAAADALKYIDLGGDIGVLANGAGLTMTTIDAIAHFGGAPANFLEIGGEAYASAGQAVDILLANPRIRSLVVNFCGAFARTDVMVQGFVSRWSSRQPPLPVFFSIHGTGEEEAVALLRNDLGVEPFDLMDDAIRAAIAAAGSR